MMVPTSHRCRDSTSRLRSISASEAIPARGCQRLSMVSVASHPALSHRQPHLQVYKLLVPQRAHTSGRAHLRRVAATVIRLRAQSNKTSSKLLVQYVWRRLWIPTCATVCSTYQRRHLPRIKEDEEETATLVSPPLTSAGTDMCLTNSMLIRLRTSKHFSVAILVYPPGGDS